MQSHFRAIALFLFVALGLPMPGDLVAKPTEAMRMDVGGYSLNSVLFEPNGKAALPPIVFIHGASTSLYDPMYSFRSQMEGHARLLFVDRPGHGQSDVGGSVNTFPDGQADAIATLMRLRGIRRAIIVSHSFGGAVAAELAVRHPDMVMGLVFLSPAVYTWKGSLSWYYEVARVPLVGWLFSGLVVPPAGALTVDSATKAVFAPNPRPDDYVRQTHAYQAIAPAAFRHNAIEIDNLQSWAKRAAAGYKSIRVPTIIVTGDADGIVSPSVHARHLARDIRGARLIVIHNLGHKSDYVARDLAIAAIKTIAGTKVDLRTATKRIEKQIEGDRK